MFVGMWVTDRVRDKRQMASDVCNIQNGDESREIIILFVDILWFKIRFLRMQQKVMKAIWIRSLSTVLLIITKIVSKCIAMLLFFPAGHN